MQQLQQSQQLQQPGSWRFVPDTILPGYQWAPQWVPARTPTVHWGPISGKALGGPNTVQHSSTVQKHCKLFFLSFFLLFCLPFLSSFFVFLFCLPFLSSFFLSSFFDFFFSLFLFFLFLIVFEMFFLRFFSPFFSFVFFFFFSFFHCFLSFSLFLNTFFFLFFLFLHLFCFFFHFPLFFCFFFFFLSLDKSMLSSGHSFLCLQLVSFRWSAFAASVPCVWGVRAMHHARC